MNQIKKFYEELKKNYEEEKVWDKTHSDENLAHVIRIVVPVILVILTLDLVGKLFPLLMNFILSEPDLANNMWTSIFFPISVLFFSASCMVAILFRADLYIEKYALIFLRSPEYKRMIVKLHGVTWIECVSLIFSLVVSVTFLISWMLVIALGAPFLISALMTNPNITITRMGFWGYNFIVTIVPVCVITSVMYGLWCASVCFMRKLNQCSHEFLTVITRRDTVEQHPTS